MIVLTHWHVWRYNSRNKDILIFISGIDVLQRNVIDAATLIIIGLKYF